MSKVIRSPRQRVWDALTLPSELIRWDDRRLSLEAPAPGHPRLGQAAEWLCLLGSVKVRCSEEPIEILPEARLRTAVALGAFRFEETYTLVDEEPSGTRVSLALAARNSVPLFDNELDRFDVRKLCVERVDANLSLLQRWCERPRRAQDGRAPLPSPPLS
ncbi:MAG: SRPBCC family protein [Myxococcota bacterium]